MNRAKTMFLGVMLATAGLMLAGCLERTETIVVKPDGSAELEVVVSSPQSGTLTLAVTPAEPAGWKVERTQVRDAKGNVSRHVVTATRTVAAGQAWPENDAAPDDPDAELYLQFPTTLTVEKRDGRTWYNFRRVYPARAFAWYQAIQDQQPDRKVVEETLKKPKAEVTADEWRTVIRSMAQVEAQRHLAAARKAFLEVTPNLPQDRWLAVYKAGMSALDELDYDLLVKLVSAENDDAAGQRLIEEAQRMNQAIEERIRTTLSQAAGYSSAQLAAFNERYDRIHRRVKLTADMQAYSYTVRVALPGQVFASNADAVESGTLVWRFKGEAVFDRDLELLASSYVEAERGN